MLGAWRPGTADFVSADPIIQDAANPQSFNRYAYVYNNPLSFTDPHGFSAWSQWIRPVVITVATWYVLGPGGAFGASGVFGAVGGSAGLFGSTLANGFASAAAAGFAAGGIQGGNIESAVYGAFSAVAFYGVGQSATFLADKYGTAFWGSGAPGRVVRHGAAGCASASVAGGSCGHGAISAAFAEAAGPNVSSVTGGNKVAGFVSAVVAGGGAARLAGGKFANGAATGAFSYLYNELAGQTTKTQRGYARDAMSWPESRAEYRAGTGTDVRIDVDTLDFSGLTDSGWNSANQKQFTFPVWNPKDMFVHGTVTIQRSPDDTFSVLSERYNNDHKPALGLLHYRNVETFINRVLHGSGQPYTVYFDGARRFSELERLR